jgi:hypothetical protein
MDIGCGWGEWGFLVRLHLEDPESWPQDPRRIQGWHYQVDGIELKPENVGFMHEIFYDSVQIGNVFDLLDALPDYDVFLLSHFIEHLEKKEACELLRFLVDRSNQAVILATPLGFMPHGAALGQEGERHRSGWWPAEFRRFGHVSYFYEALEAGYPELVVTITQDEAVHRKLKPRASRWRWLVRPAICNLLGPCVYDWLKKRAKRKWRASLEGVPEPEKTPGG